MIDEQTRSAITPADEARAAKFLARDHADFPELASLFASHREAAMPPIGSDLADDAARMIRSLTDSLAVSDHIVESNGRIITASGILAKIGKA